MIIKMKTNYIYIIIFIILGSCSSVKKNMTIKGNLNDAIENAILDLLHSNTFKKEQVFVIYTESINSDVYGISFMEADNKLLPNSNNKIGTNHPYFPTRYIVKNNKLFYWYDSNNFITKDLIDTLAKYNQIDSLNVEKFVGIPKTSALINDSKKGIDYYFCKNNLVKYKKIITNKAIGYYKPPTLKCSKN